MDYPTASNPAPALFIQKVFRAILFVASAMLFSPALGHTGQWQVNPAMISLSREAKSSVITITNEGEDKINLQVKAMEWSQDPEGKDIYKDTNDLVFFPRILMISKDEQKIVRAGIKIPAVSKEKTYRLFIEEIPQPRKTTGEATQLTIAMRFGVPVFSKPLKQEPAAELATVQLTPKGVSATIRNTGNSHFRITEIILKGVNGKSEETFVSKLNGWYLLPDANRTYSIPIPAGKCVSTKQLDLTILTDTKVKLNRNVNVDKGQCPQ